MKEEKSANQRTTVNLPARIYEKLHDVSRKSGISPNEVMRKALKKLVPELGKEKFENCTIKYQSPEDDWNNQHITISQVEYDTFMDIKKVIRLSFSYLVTMAIEKYSDIIDTVENCFSFYDTAYLKQLKILNDIRIYSFCWGIPDEPIQLEIPPPK